MTQDEEIAALRAENARLRDLVRRSLAAINSAYEEALADQRGHDRTADRHNRIVGDYRFDACAALGGENG